MWISDDEAFDDAVSTARGKKFWTLIPSSDMETNCVDAVNDALQAGGVDIYRKDLRGYLYMVQTPSTLMRSLQEISQSSKIVRPVR